MTPPLSILPAVHIEQQHLPYTRAEVCSLAAAAGLRQGIDFLSVT